MGNLRYDTTAATATPTCRSGSWWRWGGLLPPERVERLFGAQWPWWHAEAHVRTHALNLLAAQPETTAGLRAAAGDVLQRLTTAAERGAQGGANGPAGWVPPV